MPRILIVQDDDDFAGLLSEMLVERGYEILAVKNGNQGLSALAEQSFDLVVVDISVPEKEGVETIRAIKKINPALPVVAMTGGGISSGDLSPNLAQSAGASETITKPFRIGKLLIVINEILRAT
jgi:DNA-binding response OmpR family regulator